MIFGQIIKTKRLELGLTLQDVADECGIHRDYLSKLEKDKTEAYSEGVVYKLAEILGIDGVDELIISKGECPKWVQKFVVKNWKIVKIFIDATKKKKLKV